MRVVVISVLSVLSESDLSVPLQEAAIPDKRVWSMEECGSVFQTCVTKLKERLKTSEEPLVWDKDDASAMDFVAATANIRSHIFHIPEKSRLVSVHLFIYLIRLNFGGQDLRQTKMI